MAYGQKKKKKPDKHLFSSIMCILNAGNQDTTKNCCFLGYDLNPQLRQSPHFYSQTISLGICHFMAQAGMVTSLHLNITEGSLETSQLILTSPRERQGNPNIWDALRMCCRHPCSSVHFPVSLFLCPRPLATGTDYLNYQNFAPRDHTDCNAESWRQKSHRNNKRV